jgi:hypothetical protein
MKPALPLVSSALAATALLVTAAYLGCAAVPDIRFVAEDAGSQVDADAATPTDGAPTADGAMARDAAAGCTTASPGGGATCCGDVWCTGDCSATNCDQCASRGCQTGELCCGKMGTVVCKTRCP